MKMARHVIAVLSASVMLACASTAQRPPAAPPPANDARPLPESIRWVRASAEHHALFIQTFAAAADRVREAASSRKPGSWAVILDADETILDNSEYQRRRAAQGLGFSQETWDAWVKEEKATLLPGAADFLATVRTLGGRVAIVTNRDDYICDPTRRNITAAGLTVDVVLCRADRVSDKNPRFEAVRRGDAIAGSGALDVIVWIGDNIQDFPALSQELRGGPAEAFSNFGRRYFMLPNPMYGSWERLPVP